MTYWQMVNLRWLCVESAEGLAAEYNAGLGELGTYEAIEVTNEVLEAFKAANTCDGTNDGGCYFESTQCAEINAAIEGVAEMTVPACMNPSADVAATELETVGLTWTWVEAEADSATKAALGLAVTATAAMMLF